MDPKEAIQVLINDGISAATRMLGEGGEFHPYGRSLGREYAITDIAAGDGEDFPPGARLMDLLEEGLRQRVNSTSDIAVATFAKVRLRNENDKVMDAVQIGLEHECGYAITVYFPYRIAASGVTYDELITALRDPSIFITSSGNGVS